MADVSVVVPVWAVNEQAELFTLDCARHVRATAPDVELVMVVAGVGDAELDELDELCDVCLAMDPPQGWATATNMGIVLASSEWIVVGSNDIRPEEDWLARMLDVADENTIVSPFDYKPDGGWRKVTDGQRGSFWGGWFLFHASVVERIGYFDGYMMRMAADFDWAIRARQAGVRTVRADVKATHLEPHHVAKQWEDPYQETRLRLFREKYGVGRFGDWERQHG